MLNKALDTKEEELLPLQIPTEDESSSSSTDRLCLLLGVAYRHVLCSMRVPYTVTLLIHQRYTVALLIL
ncbi:hypothetical protein NL676_038086 [Syzygium grande]|nr:hypothetical protein NL676_038086 [Syzygium grande]